MKNPIKLFTLILLILVLKNSGFAQTLATTSEGKEVVLYKDGTYKTVIKTINDAEKKIVLFEDGTFLQLKNASSDETHKNPKSISIEKIPEAIKPDDHQLFDDLLAPDVVPDPDIEILKPEVKAGFPGLLAPDVVPEPDIEILKPEVKAGFPGGDGAFREFVASEFVNTHGCMDKEKSAQVVLRFVVDQGGRISRISIIESSSACTEYNKEAVRILKRSPRWIPGQVRGRFVNSWRVVTIRLGAR